MLALGITNECVKELLSSQTQQVKLLQHHEGQVVNSTTCLSEFNAVSLYHMAWCPQGWTTCAYYCEWLISAHREWDHSDGHARMSHSCRSVTKPLK